MLWRLWRLWRIRREMREDLELWSVCFSSKNKVYQVGPATELCMRAGERFPRLYHAPGGEFFVVSVEKKGRRGVLKGAVVSRQEALNHLMAYYGVLEYQMLSELHSLAVFAPG